MKSKKMAWICLCTGYFGVHKFIEKKVGMGILYICTFGLLGVGWIYDTVNYFKMANEQTEFYNDVDEIQRLTPEEKQFALSKYNIENPGINLNDGEHCYYSGPAQAYTSINVVVGTKGGGAGISFKVSKNIRIHTGGGNSKTIRDNISEVFDGNFYVTDQRVILLTPKHGFNIPYKKLTAMSPASDGIQFYDNTGKCYIMLTKDVYEICKIMNYIQI